MARKTNPDAPRRERDNGNWSGYQQQNQQGQWRYTFVNVPLTDQDVARIKEWAPTNDQMSDLLDKLAESDYKVDVRWDTKYECYSAILYPIGEDHINAGSCLSGRGTSSMKAIRQAAYKCYVICDNVWGSWSDRKDKFELDD